MLTGVCTTACRGCAGCVQDNQHPEVIGLVIWFAPVYTCFHVIKTPTQTLGRSLFCMTGQFVGTRHVITSKSHPDVFASIKPYLPVCISHLSIKSSNMVLTSLQGSASFRVLIGSSRLLLFRGMKLVSHLLILATVESCMT